MNKDKTGNERYRRWYARHVEEIKEQRKQLYLTRKLAGLCPRCGTDTKDGGLCEECLRKARTWNRKKSESAGEGDTEGAGAATGEA